ncbi:MAG TPA: OsmC family protein [Caldimonas sp.]|nr:OsmC family protein [Caldimonas sp.]HEX4233026.1 OsmC family protein [Caldimonas sp.]
MTNERVATAVARIQAVLRRKPELGLHDDTAANARWLGATRCVARHPSGIAIATDMPADLGGEGEEVTPGWLFRAGIAWCAATAVAITAAARGIALAVLEVEVRSRPDLRGLFAMAGADGRVVSAASNDLRMPLRIAAAGVPAARMRTLVEDSCRCSPVPGAVVQATPIALQVDMAAD